jgi:hypothetical protein
MTVNMREGFEFGWYDSLLTEDGMYFEKLLLLLIAAYLPENGLKVFTEEGYDLSLSLFVRDDDVGFVFKAMRIRAVMEDHKHFRHLNMTERLDLIPFCQVSNAKEEYVVQSAAPSAPPQTSLCAVCLNNTASLLTIPCGHLATCLVVYPQKHEYLRPVPHMIHIDLIVNVHIKGSSLLRKYHIVVCFIGL